MKKLLLIALLLPVAAFCQKDFDYSFYTLKNTLVLEERKDSLLPELFLPRKIQKENNELKVISLTNTAQTETYRLEYIGYDIIDKWLIYQDAEGLYFYINPGNGLLEILNKKTGTKLSYY